MLDKRKRDQRGGLQKGKDHVDWVHAQFLFHEDGSPQNPTSVQKCGLPKKKIISRIQSVGLAREKTSADGGFREKEGIVRSLFGER